MSGFPALPRLLIWAAITGAISMALYWLCSAQDKVGAAKERAISARKAMAAYQGTDFDEMMPLAIESLASSLKHFAIVLVPALLSSLPALTLIVWVSGQFGYLMPEPGAAVSVTTIPAVTIQDAVLAGDSDEGSYTVNYPAIDDTLDIVAASGTLITTLPLHGPVPVIHKKVWWNSLIGNPNGYLPDDHEIEAIYFDLASMEFLPVGPGWVRGWEFSYFVLLIIVSFGIKIAFRIH